MDCIEGLKLLEDNSVDSIVTDPPYELGFMGKKWDSTGIAYSVPLWRECLRVLKPGGHLLSFGGTRTYHRMACAIEDAGFEIRDQIQWLYGSGFPKSMNIGKAIDKSKGATREVVGITKGKGGENLNVLSREGANDAEDAKGCGAYGKGAKQITINIPITAPATPEAKQWDGWGTALKPANEPIVLARKPLSEKTVATNVLKWGTGGLNIDECRIETTDNLNGGAYSGGQRCDGDWKDHSGFKNDSLTTYVQPQGRFPANVIFDEDAGKALDEQSGISTSTKGKQRSAKIGNQIKLNSSANTQVNCEYNDSGGASRFFYCAKASKKDRGIGNNHPTVKPLKLMEHLITLVTPPEGTILDPFVGSGTTLVAAKELGFSYVGFELSKEYCDIANARIASLCPPIEIQRN